MLCNIFNIMGVKDQESKRCGTYFFNHWFIVHTYVNVYNKKNLIKVCMVCFGYLSNKLLKIGKLGLIFLHTKSLRLIDSIESSTLSNNGFFGYGINFVFLVLRFSFNQHIWLPIQLHYRIKKRNKKEKGSQPLYL